MPSSAGSDVVRYLILLLIAGNLFALAVGVMMLLAPARLNAWFNVTDRLISMRRLTKPLDGMRDTDATLFRYSRRPPLSSAACGCFGSSPCGAGRKPPTAGFPRAARSSRWP